MKLNLIKLKNCLGIQELELTAGKVMLIEGKEGEGKTSILESIQRIFSNKNERPTFVHTEGEKAEAYLLLDDGTNIKKLWNKDNKVTTVTIEKDGMSPKNPETYLKGLVSDSQLNPISLIQMNDKELSALILSLIPIKVTKEDLVDDGIGEMPFIDFGKHGLQICKDVEKSLFDKRTETNRRLKDLEYDIKINSEKLPAGYNADGWRDVTIQEKYEKIKNANDINAKVDEANAIISSIDERIIGLESERNIKTEQLEIKIAEIKEQYQTKINDAKTFCADAKKFLELNTQIDITGLEEDLAHTEKMKSLVSFAEDIRAKRSTLLALDKESQELTYKINHMRAKPAMLLRNARMPVEGISIGVDGSVLINERPIINLSGGERIKFVMNIVRAMSGNLKLILINGIEALSPESQKQFIDECKHDEFQYFITRVTDGELDITTIDNENHINAISGEILN